MTLIINMPYKEGIIVIADKRNSYDNSHEDIITKIYKMNNWAFSCAGKTDLGSNIVYKFKDIKTDIINEFESYLKEIINDSKYGSGNSFIICIFLNKTMYIYNNSYRVCEKTLIHPYAIGNEMSVSMLNNYFDKINTFDYSEKEAIDFGFTFINFCSYFDYTVSSALTGYDILIYKNNTFDLKEKVISKDDKLINLTPIHYNKTGVDFKYE